MVSAKVVGRLSLYRRILKGLEADGAESVFSHDLAALARCTPAQVRRDVMTIGFSGSPARGYDIAALIGSIGEFLDGPESEGTVLVGVGNLGRAFLAYFVGRNARFSIVAAFDSDAEKVNRVIHGCRCYPVGKLGEVVAERGARLALVAVPANAAQETANQLFSAGIRGIINFAPVQIWVPEGVYVENVDVTMRLERVAYFARSLS